MDIPKENESFEGSLERLEKIVGELERGDLPLEKSLAKYEEGIGRLKQCYRTLEEIEKKIVLISKREDGSFEELPFERSRNNAKTTRATKKNQ